MAYGVYSYEWVETSIGKFVVLYIADIDISTERLADPLKSALPVDCGEVTPVEWAVAHDEARSPSL